MDPKELGQPVQSILRDPERTKTILKYRAKGNRVQEFEDEGLHPIYTPFWADLPHCDIFNAITPDILHQLHKGVFKDHLVTWCMEIASEHEVDEHFKSMIAHQGLRHFRKGISKVEQWTGKEMKEMQKVFGCLMPGAAQERVVKAVHAIIDFIYYAQFQSHTSETLLLMQAALDQWHLNNVIFLKLEVREHFNIPKFHSMQHYIDMIKSHGAADGYNTEASKRLHIDYAKNAYRASNKRDYVEQMALWLQRQEAVARFNAYLTWLGKNPVQEDLDEDIDDNDEEKDLNDTDTTAAFFSGPYGAPSSYLLAKASPSPNTSVAKIVESYEASQFLPALSSYLNTSHPDSPTPTEHDIFEIYNQITLQLPQNNAVDSTKHTDRVRATPAIASKPGKAGRLAHFDTALVRVNKDDNAVTVGTRLQGE